eukprot:Pgem_evm1s6843
MLLDFDKAQDIEVKAKFCPFTLKNYAHGLTVHARTYDQKDTLFYREYNYRVMFDYGVKYYLDCEGKKYCQ